MSIIITRREFFVSESQILEASQNGSLKTELYNLGSFLHTDYVFFQNIFESWNPSSKVLLRKLLVYFESENGEFPAFSFMLIKKKLFESPPEKGTEPNYSNFNFDKIITGINLISFEPLVYKWMKKEFEINLVVQKEGEEIDLFGFGVVINNDKTFEGGAKLKFVLQGERVL